jgi:uncharacterized protein (DUF952 family)
MTELLHLTERATWQSARLAGEFRSSTRGRPLEEQGFIHCSLPHQLRAVAEFVYSDVTEDLVVLVIDSGKLGVPVVFESPAPGEQEFPHIYGPVPISAVIRVVEVTKDQAGRFILPG